MLAQKQDNTETCACRASGLQAFSRSASQKAAGGEEVREEAAVSTGEGRGGEVGLRDAWLHSPKRGKPRLTRAPEEALSEDSGWMRWLEGQKIGTLLTS